jgi:hypothetical protein
MNMLQDKEAQCAVDDYGRDLDDCKALVTAWERTMRELSAAGKSIPT